MSRLGLLQPRPPDVAIEIDATHVAAARITSAGGGLSHAGESLPPGAVAPALLTLNINDPALVARVLSRVVAKVGGRVTRAALVVPDTVAKVSLIRFDQVPAAAADLDELVRWQVRKATPFPLDQAVVSFTPAGRVAGGQEFLVSTARTDVIAQYEAVCQTAGIHAGLVDLATPSLINGVLAGTPPTGDWLLVHATTTYTTLVVLRGADVIFFRHREQEGDDTLAGVVHQTAMYYEDRLNGSGFSRVLLAGGAVEAVDEVRRSLEQRLEMRIEPIAHAETATLLGLLTREQKVA